MKKIFLSSFVALAAFSMQAHSASIAVQLTGSDWATADNALGSNGNSGLFQIRPEQDTLPLLFLSD